MREHTNLKAQIKRMTESVDRMEAYRKVGDLGELAAEATFAAQVAEAMIRSCARLIQMEVE